MQALEVEVVLQRYVVVHPHVTPGEPGGGALDPTGAALVQPHQPAARRRMGGEHESLDRIRAFGCRPGGDDQDLVGLPDRLARPIGERVVGQIGDQLVFVLDGVEPIRHRRVVGGPAGKVAVEVIAREQAALAAAADDVVEAIVEGLRDRLVAAGDHRDGARGGAARLLGAACAAVGEPAG